MLGLVGASTVVKDPRWAVEVLRILRRTDPRYQLRLLGNRFAAESSAPTRAYAAGLERDLAELTPSGAVVDVGFTEDVPAALEDVGG